MCTACLLSSGCIIIPIPRPETRVVDSRRALDKDSAKVMQQADGAAPIAATRADVLLALGEPDLAWDEGRVIVYKWTTTKMSFLVAVSGGAGGGGAGVIDSPINYYLFFEFDSLGVVRRWERRKAPAGTPGNEYTRKMWRNW